MPDASMAALMAVAPSWGAVMLARLPIMPPIGVRLAARNTTSVGWLMVNLLQDYCDCQGDYHRE
jgi:hypothetical protein